MAARSLYPFLCLKVEVPLGDGIGKEHRLPTLVKDTYCVLQPERRTQGKPRSVSTRRSQPLN